jgi:hypothetical protein
MNRFLVCILLLTATSICQAQDYCPISSGCDEYISRVQLEEIDNS